MYKKGPREGPANYRYLMLIQMTVRILGKVMAMRLVRFAEDEQRLCDTQFGFRPGRSVLDPALIFSLLLEMVAEVETSDTRLTSTCADPQQAYPSTARGLCFGVLRGIGVPEKLTTMMHELQNHSFYTVRNVGQRSRPVYTRCGLLEGAPEAPLVFSMYHSAVLKVYERCAAHHEPAMGVQVEPQARM